MCSAKPSKPTLAKQNSNPRSSSAPEVPENPEVPEATAVPALMNLPLFIARRIYGSEDHQREVSRPAIRIAMNEEDGARIQIERELRHEPRIILVAALHVRILAAVRQRIGRVDRHRPLHVARQLVEIVDRIIGTVP